jgi:hypothetical protein
VVSGYSLRLEVLPNPAIPERPADGPQPPRLPSVSTIQRHTGPLDPACLTAGIGSFGSALCAIRRTDNFNTIYAERERFVRLFLIFFETESLQRSLDAVFATVDRCSRNPAFARYLRRFVMKKQPCHFLVGETERP